MTYTIRIEMSKLRKLLLFSLSGIVSSFSFGELALVFQSLLWQEPQFDIVGWMFCGAAAAAFTIILYDVLRTRFRTEVGE